MRSSIFTFVKMNTLKTNFVVINKSSPVDSPLHINLEIFLTFNCLFYRSITGSCSDVPPVSRLQDFRGQETEISPRKNHQEFSGSS